MTDYPITRRNSLRTAFLCLPPAVCPWEEAVAALVDK